MIILSGSSLSLADVCAQNLLPGQPDASCVIQVIASNGTVWAGVVNDAPSPSGSSGGAPRGLAEGQKAAVIVVTGVGGLILIGALAAVLYMYCRLKRTTWAPTKGEFDGEASAAGGVVQLGEGEAKSSSSSAAAGGVALGPTTAPGTPSTVHFSPTHSARRAMEGEDGCELGPSGSLSSPLRSGWHGRPAGVQIAQVLITMDPAG